MSDSNVQVEGKGMAIGGFILALVGLLLAGIVMGGSYIAMGSKVVAYLGSSLYRFSYYFCHGYVQIG